MNQASRWELRLAACAVLATLLFTVLDWSFWHPGFNIYDEEAVVTRIQLGREGFSSPLVAFRGELGRLAMAGSAACFGPKLISLHLPVALAFLLENLLLFLLASRLFSSRAAAWSVIVNGLAAFTMLRARSLLMYAFLPVEWLALLVLLPLCRQRVAALLWGLAASALLLDYEAWTLGAGLLGLAFWWQHRGTNSWRWMAAGLALGSSLVLYNSFGILQGHLALRLAMNTPLSFWDFCASALRTLRAWWCGGNYLYFIAPAGHPPFPLWAYPLLGLGLLTAWKRWKSGLLWIVLGFLPLLLARDSSDEPQRAMLAWPALCIFAGAGAETFRSKFPSVLLIFLCLAGAAVEARAYVRSMRLHYAETYGESANLMAVADELKNNDNPPLRVVSELDNKSAAPFRFLISSVEQSPDSPRVVALIPWQYIPEVKKDWGERVRPLSAGSDAYSPPYLLIASPKAARRLASIEAELKPLWSRAYLDGTAHVRVASLLYLDTHPRADIWTRTACWEAFLNSTLIMRELPEPRIAQALKEPLVSATFYERLAFARMLSDPKAASALAQRALKLDPSRQNSMELYHDAQRRLEQAP